MKMNCIQSSILYNKEAIKEDPDFIESYNNLGILYRKEGFKEKAKEEFRKMLNLMKKLGDQITNKNKAEFLTNYASCLVMNGTPDEGLKELEKSYKLCPDEDTTIWNMSLCHLEKGDYEIGFQRYESGDRIKREYARKYSDHETPFWDGTKGQTVVVFGEQGIGDELMFASMIPDLIKDCKEVIIDAHLRLADIMRASFPGITVYGSREQEQLPWYKYHKIDAKIAIGSLAKFYRKKESDFPRNPYLKCNTNYKFEWDEIDSARPKIGFSWRGGLLKPTSRLIPLEYWKEIFKLDATFVSLQYNPESAKEIDEFCKKNNINNIHHWSNVLEDYDKTAALVKELDLIISVPQSVVHLAGGLGIPTWQLCPKKSMWQVGPYGKDMPWYGGVHNIWQDKTERWEPVMKTVKEKLCSLLATSTES